MRSTFKIGYAALAVAAVGSFVLINYRERDGLILAILTALGGGLLFIRHQLFREQQWFIHGYHAGYHHAAENIDCYGSACEVLDVAQERAQQDAAGR